MINLKTLICATLTQHSNIFNLRKKQVAHTTCYLVAVPDALVVLVALEWQIVRKEIGGLSTLLVNGQLPQNKRVTTWPKIASVTGSTRPKQAMFFFVPTTTCLRFRHKDPGGAWDAHPQ